MDELAKSSEFLGRLQLYSKGRAVNRRLVKPGNYGIPISDDEVHDLGDTIDILPLARRPKAIDMSDPEAVIAVCNVQCPEFKRIREQSSQADSHCLVGPSFLVIERSTRRFLEFFCGSKSARGEAKKIFSYLTLTQGAIDVLATKGEDTTGMVPHGPLPLTLKSKLVEEGDVLLARAGGNEVR